MSERKNNRKSAAKAAAGAARATKSIDSTNPMDLGLLEQIVKLMAANDLNTVDVRDGEKRVILKRGAAAAAQPVAMPFAMHAPASHAPAAAAPAAAGPKAPAAGAAAEDESNLTPIKSPMVGTFYASPSPDAKPFVGVGSTVDEETDVCIIEAMKVFNNIKAETRGTIAKVLVTNGQTVEFGQTLFLVKPS